MAEPSKLRLMHVINWHHKHLRNWPDILPAAWFFKTGKLQGVTHRIGKDPRSAYAGRCDITIKEKSAVLNYFPKKYSGFNDTNGNIVGRMELIFTSNKRAHIEEIRWTASKKLKPTKANAHPTKLIDHPEKAKFPKVENDKTVLQLIRQRLGQPKLRGALLNAYENKCAISECKVTAVLEAAHIVPYKDHGEYDVTNGVLLRSDLHTLFDMNLLRVNPITLKVVLDPSIRKGPYLRFHGRKLFQPKEKEERASRIYLYRRWNDYKERPIKA